MAYILRKKKVIYGTLQAWGVNFSFLLIIQVHHFAMIRGICQRAGNELDPDFGMALSTLRHHRELAKNVAKESTQRAI